MVDWIKTEAKIREIKSESIKAQDVLDRITSNKSFLATVQVEDTNVDIDLKTLFRPLGDYWRTLFNEGDYDALRDGIVRYWRYRGTPIINVDLLETDDGVIPIRVAMNMSEVQKKRFVDINKLISEVNESVNYDRCVLGSDDSDLEFQFLNSSHRRVVQPGDALDSGIFVHVNGGVRVSPGVHRLVCSNGLTEQMHMWKGRDYKFGDSLVTRAVGLSQWFAEQSNKKVCNSRELSVALKDYPNTVITKFWKGWTERIDLKDLTWYDVINDITQSVNDTLSAKRYRLISTSGLFEYEKEHRCGVCSSKIV